MIDFESILHIKSKSNQVLEARDIFINQLRQAELSGKICRCPTEKEIVNVLDIGGGKSREQNAQAILKLLKGER